MKIKSFILSLFLSAIALAQGSSPGMVPTLRDLTNRPPSQINPVVFTQGRLTQGDGKGGMFTWVPSSTASIDWTNVLGSALTSTGRWLLSLPSPTPEVSDSSKVDRVSGTGTGLDLTDTDLLGTTRVNGVNLESSLASKIAGSVAAGMIPAGTGTTTVASSGISTNALRFIDRVVMNPDELVAISPQMFLATTGGTLAHVTTISNGVAGAAQQHWMYDSTMTGTTNFAYAGGPIAYPYGASAGRWFEVKPYTAVGARVMVLAPLYPDAADGTTNPNDPSTYINGVYAAASSAYDSQLGPVTVDHPTGTFTVNELFWYGKVTYNADGFTRYKKRSHPSGLLNRSIASTRRLGYMNIDSTDQSFLNWGIEGGTNDYFAVSDRWYGLSDDIRFTGQGKIVYDQNQKDCTQPLLRIFEVQNLVVENGVVEVWHNASTNVGVGSPVNSWGISLIGRNVKWYSPIIRYGTLTTQDGMHICAGRDIFIYNGFGQSGDDSLVCESESAGAYTSPSDEPLERVYVNGWHAESRRGRAAVILTGPNWINAPYVNRSPELRAITIDGVTGTAAVERSYGIGIGNFQDGSGIFTYTITDPGSGYTDGYYVIGVGNTGGGSGAQCAVKVVGGEVVRAYMANVAGAWEYGTGYRQDQLATVASIPGGSGAIITGTVLGCSNDRVVNCAIRNFDVDIGSTTHDGNEPYAIKFNGARESEIGPGFIRVTDNTANPTWPTNAFRPYYVQASSNCVVRGVYVSETYRGGAIVANDFPKTYVNGITFDNCTFGPHSNGGHGICKINGDTVGRVTFQKCTLKVGTGLACFYLPDLESSKAAHTDLLEVDNCTIIAPSGASNTRAIDFVPNGGTGNMLGKLRFVGNTLINITTEDTQAVINAACTQWEIDGNSGGYRTKLGNVVTQTSGTTQVSVTISTVTGLIGNTTASLPCVRVVPLGNPGSNWWIEPSTTGAFLIKTASAVGADLNWAVYVDTSRKPLTAY